MNNIIEFIENNKINIYQIIYILLDKIIKKNILNKNHNQYLELYNKNILSMKFKKQSFFLKDDLKTLTIFYNFLWVIKKINLIKEMEIKNMNELKVIELREIDVQNVKKELKVEIKKAIDLFKILLENKEKEIVVISEELKNEDEKIANKANEDLNELKKSLKELSKNTLEKSAIIKKPLKELSDLIIKDFENKVKEKHSSSLLDPVINKIVTVQSDYRLMLQKKMQQKLEEEMKKQLEEKQRQLEAEMKRKEDDIFYQIEKEKELEKLEKEKQEVKVETTKDIKIEGLRQTKIYKIVVNDVEKVKHFVNVGAERFEFLQVNESEIKRYIIANKKINPTYKPEFDANLVGLFVKQEIKYS